MAGTSRKDDSFVEFVCDQLGELDAVTYKPMFGGYGLYEGALFFGIVFDGRLYFKTNASTRPRYEEWGSEAFQPNAKQTLKNYYEVPGAVIDDADALNELAREAIEASART